MRIADDISFGVELEGLIPCPEGMEHLSGSLRQDGLMYVRDALGLMYVRDALRAAALPSIVYDVYGLRKSSSPSHWVCKHDETIHPTDKDKACHKTQDFISFEIASPVLVGEQGLELVKKMLATTAALGAFANATCGWHVHLSPKDRRYTKQELCNFVTAASEHEKEYLTLIGDDRIGNYSCLSYLSSRIEGRNIEDLSAKDLAGNDKFCKITLMRADPLDIWGALFPFKSNSHRNPFMKTIEFKGKEAEGFEINSGAEHLDYTAAVVNFASMAIKDPAASFRDAARIACQDKRGEIVPTRTLELATHFDEFSL